MALEVNEAVEVGHSSGVLSAASLMVGGAAASDAVMRAQRLPRLRVGLHLVLVEGRPTLSPDRIPDLVTADGVLRTDMAALGASIWLRASVRRQVAAEIAAQFEAFAATGLPLDHVNAHKHFHLHPTIASMLMQIGPRFGMRAVRAPVEPRRVLARVEPASPPPSDWLAQSWAALLQKRLRRNGVKVADQVFGNGWSGAMTAERMTALMSDLPEGVTEIYTHPATKGGFEGAAAHYRYRDELIALRSGAVAAALEASGATTGGYLDAGIP
ncbi:MAG: carbohydrate deacetylase 1 [Betaproteobacteria bacterium]|nr:carbohydrate deacetylase 1 [Betaproteobacteria bacterium]